MSSFHIGDFVASPGCAKYGLVVALNGPYVCILWEGHAVPYDCLPTSAQRVEMSTVPQSIRYWLLESYVSVA